MPKKLVYIVNKIITFSLKLYVLLLLSVLLGGFILLAREMTYIFPAGSRKLNERVELNDYNIKTIYELTLPYAKSVDKKINRRFGLLRAEIIKDKWIYVDFEDNTEKRPYFVFVTIAKKDNDWYVTYLDVPERTGKLSDLGIFLADWEYDLDDFLDMADLSLDEVTEIIVARNKISIKTGEMWIDADPLKGYYERRIKKISTN